MRSAREFALAAASAALLVCARARADQRIGIEGWGGLNQHAMSAMNDTLASFNHEYRIALAPIHRGGSWGFALRSWILDQVLLRLSYERLFARSEDSGVEFDLGAHAITLGATGFFPSSSRLRYGGGLALGPLFATGGVAASKASLKASGKGFGVQATGEATMAAAGGLSLVGAAGYRWARIQQLKLADNPSDMSLDYSGFFVRLGLALDWRKATHL